MNIVYNVTLAVSSVVIFVAVMLMTRLKIPREKSMSRYRLAHNLLLIAYLVLFIANLTVLFTSPYHVRLTFILGVTLIVASYEAAFFTASLLTLVQGLPSIIKKFQVNFFIITLFSVLLGVSMFLFTTKIFSMLFYFCLAIYILQLGYYVYLFLKGYNNYIKSLDNFFAGDEPEKMVWIRNGFFMALGIGVLSLVALFLPLSLYVIYVLVFTIFYLYFAVSAVKFFKKFPGILPTELILVSPYIKEDIESPKGYDAIAPALGKWIDAKGYMKQGITLRTLAAELSTNQTYLSLYVNSYTGLSFRNWISSLRIEEAKRLLNEEIEFPVSYIGERVGIPNKSSFFRQFINITGKTPGAYRDEL